MATDRTNRLILLIDSLDYKQRDAVESFAYKLFLDREKGPGLSEFARKVVGNLAASLLPGHEGCEDRRISRWKAHKLLKELSRQNSDFDDDRLVEKAAGALSDQMARSEVSYEIARAVAAQLLQDTQPTEYSVFVQSVASIVVENLVPQLENADDSENSELAQSVIEAFAVKLLDTGWMCNSVESLLHKSIGAMATERAKKIHATHQEYLVGKLVGELWPEPEEEKAGHGSMDPPMAELLLDTMYRQEPISTHSVFASRLAEILLSPQSSYRHGIDLPPLYEEIVQALVARLVPGFESTDYRPIAGRVADEMARRIAVDLENPSPMSSVSKAVVDILANRLFSIQEAGGPLEKSIQQAVDERAYALFEEEQQRPHWQELIDQAWSATTVANRAAARADRAPMSETISDADIKAERRAWQALANAPRRFLSPKEQELVDYHCARGDE